MNHRVLVLALLGALATGLAGCASKVPIRARGPSGGTQGGAWELVVPGPEVALALAGEGPTTLPGYMTRRDHALGVTTPSWAPVAASGSGPATIERQRSVHLRRSHDTFMFFTSPRQWAPPAPWWWGDPPDHQRRWDP